MIKCDMGAVELSGSIEWLLSELLCINKAMIKTAQNRGVDEIESYELVRKATEDAITFAIKDESEKDWREKALDEAIQKLIDLLKEAHHD